jgi:hypothetical protein
VAAPMPRAAPVTTATRCDASVMCLLLVCRVNLRPGQGRKPCVIRQSCA